VKQAGKPRIAAIAERCKPGETAISWNSVSPPGPTEPAGAQAPPGETGPQVPLGSRGAPLLPG